MDAGVLVAADAGTTVEAPSVVTLIEAEETVLVDTSFGDPEAVGRRHPGFAVHREPGQSLRAVLGAEGYGPDDVDSVVLTHLDWDHCHNLRLFDEGTTVYVSERELAYARSPYPIHADRYEDGHEQPWRRVELAPFDGETEICAGVTAFPTPGHTPGHASVAVETDGGTTVVAADAVPTLDNVRPADEPLSLGLAIDEVAWYRSALAVRARADRIVPGHDWAVLEDGPAGLV
jgi:glyoxylase-like metal-dependent hydrolase (beta-lactamase superfamily II)